jgi:MoaA/NifB/PqqE/SkfB family radical SAM enzyme
MHPGLMRTIFATGALMDQGLYTNGTRIDEAAGAVIKDHCTWVYVSLDHADADEYVAHKGVDAFSYAVEGTRHLTGGDATVGLGFLLGPHNWGKATEMVRLGRELGVDYVQFRPLVVSQPEKPGELAEATAWVDQFLDGAERVNLAGTGGVMVDLSRFRMYRDWDGHGYKECWWCSLQTVITPDGNVWLCANRRGQPGALIGHLREIQQAWAGLPAPEPVGDGCRLLCRGHIPNLILNDILKERPHGNFI